MIKNKRKSKKLSKLPEQKNYFKSLEKNLLQALNSVESSSDEAKENKVLDNFINSKNDVD